MQLILGDINRDEYKTAKAELDSEFERLSRAFAKVNDDAERSSAIKAAKFENRQMAKQICDENCLTQQLADLLVDKVRVFPNNRLEIQWEVSGFANDTMERGE